MPHYSSARQQGDEVHMILDNLAVHEAAAVRAFSLCWGNTGDLFWGYTAFGPGALHLAMCMRNVTSPLRPREIQLVVMLENDLLWVEKAYAAHPVTGIAEIKASI